MREYQYWRISRQNLGVWLIYNYNSYDIYCEISRQLISVSKINFLINCPETWRMFSEFVISSVKTKSILEILISLTSNWPNGVYHFVHKVYFDLGFVYDSLNARLVPSLLTFLECWRLESYGSCFFSLWAFLKFNCITLRITLRIPKYVVITHEADSSFFLS